MAAFVEMANRRLAHEEARTLSTTALATQGEAKKINSRIKALSRQ